MSTWEERMSQRAGGMNAQERARMKLPKVDRFGRDERRRLEYEQSMRDNGFVLVGGTEIAWNGGTRIIGGKWFKPEPEEGPDYCRECSGWNSEEGVWMVNCFVRDDDGGTVCRVGHAHHEGEVWMA